MNDSSNHPESKWQTIKENGKLIIIALTIALVIRWLIAEPRYIPSDSMIPTLYRGDRLVVEKVSYHFQKPAKGDVIVFQPPEQLQQIGIKQDQAFIKRIIATEGQSVSVKNGILYLNNQPLKESYIAEFPHYQLAPVTVPPHHLFVMGDNRNNSNDSHIWGFLPEKNIIGKAVFRFWPFDRLGLI